MSEVLLQKILDELIGLKDDVKGLKHDMAEAKEAVSEIPYIKQAVSEIPYIKQAVSEIPYIKQAVQETNDMVHSIKTELVDQSLNSRVSDLETDVKLLKQIITN